MLISSFSDFFNNQAAEYVVILSASVIFARPKHKITGTA